MAPKYPKDKKQTGRVGEAGLFLVSDRTLSWEWESLPRRDPKPACERLGPIRSRKTRGKRRPEASNASPYEEGICGPLLCEPRHGSSWRTGST
jgi:hypothetical protein